MDVWKIFQDEILAEELKKSEYSDSPSTSVFPSPGPSTREPISLRHDNFSFPIEKKSVSESTNDSGNLSDEASGTSTSPLLLDPPLTDEEISADLSAIINEASGLDELDMMIQSAGPFQHPRSVAQNYAHNSGSVYHRQPSYHHSHHHQVSKYEYIWIWRFLRIRTRVNHNFPINLSELIRWSEVNDKWTRPSGFSHKIHLTQPFTYPQTHTCSTIWFVRWYRSILLSCFLVIAEFGKKRKKCKQKEVELVTENHLSDWCSTRTEFVSQIHFGLHIPYSIKWSSSSSITNVYTYLYFRLFIIIYLKHDWIILSRSSLHNHSTCFLQTHPFLPAHLRFTGFFPILFLRSFSDAHTPTQKKRKHLSISSWYRPIIFVWETQKKKKLSKNVKRKTTY